MKNWFIIFSIIMASVISGCTDSGGGVTKEQPPTPTPPIPPVIGPISLANSSALILNSLDQAVDIVRVGETFKLKFVAKDSSNNLITGLSISAAKIYAGGSDIVLAEISPGTYQISLSFPNQTTEEFNLKKDSSSINLNLNLTVSYCSNTPEIIASPFNSIVSYNSENYYVICTPQQLAAMNNPSYLNQKFILGKTIDLSSYYVDSNFDTIPENQFKIGSVANPFTGKFNAFNVAIKNFRYIGVGENDIGLFSKIGAGADIRNLILDQMSIFGQNNVGGLAGSIQNLSTPSTIIQNVTISQIEDYSNTGDYHGGLAGKIEGNVNLNTILAVTKMNLNSNSANRNYIGGLAGELKGATLNDTTTNFQLNYTSKNFTISYVGGLAGEISNSSVLTNANVIASMNINKGSNIGGIAGSIINSQYLSSFSSYNSIDFTGNNVGDFVNFGGSFGLIDSSTISSLSLSNYATGLMNDSMGLFANQVTNSTISNVVIGGNLEVSADNSSGFVSVLDNSSISRIRSYGQLTVSSSSQNISGLVSVLNDSSITRSSFNGILDADNSINVAGLASEIIGTTSISDSFVLANISGNSYVAGLVSKIDPLSTIQINRSYSYGTLIAQNMASSLVVDLTNGSSLNDSFALMKLDNGLNVLPTNSASIVANKQPSSIVSNVYFLSTETLQNVTCLGADCANNLAVTDTNTGNVLDIDYYYSSSSPPMNTWNFSVNWITSMSYFPFLR